MKTKRRNVVKSKDVVQFALEQWKRLPYKKKRYVARRVKEMECFFVPSTTPIPHLSSHSVFEMMQRQVVYLRGELNRWKQQGGDLGFCIARVQTGVPMTPLLWLSQNLVEIIVAELSKRIEEELSR